MFLMSVAGAVTTSIPTGREIRLRNGTVAVRIRSCGLEADYD